MSDWTDVIDEILKTRGDACSLGLGLVLNAATGDLGVADGALIGCWDIAAEWSLFGSTEAEILCRCCCR